MQRCARHCAQCAVKKTVPAKNSEAIFWRPRFTWPLRAGKRANANFACSEGVSAPGAPRHVPGWPFLRGLPLLCWLLCPVSRRFFRKRCIRAGILWHRLSCLPAVRFVCAVLFCFGCLFACSVLVARAFFSYLLSFAFSCLTSSSQTSFHLSLRPRRGFPCLSPPAALFPARGSCHLLLFRGLLHPLPVFPFCVVRADFLFCFSPFPA